MHITAEEFAKNAHLGQMYGEVPYWHHLRDVVGILADFGFTGRWSDAGWVHDTPEEPGVAEDTLRSLFGEWVRATVHACYGVGKFRRWRNADMYNRLIVRPEAARLKVADRISHIEAAVAGTSKTRMYLKERPEFDAHVVCYAPYEMRQRLEAGYDRLAHQERVLRKQERANK
jgi:(p)ppGpp synthase/HD superfamily hydrolase